MRKQPGLGSLCSKQAAAKETAASRRGSRAADFYRRQQAGGQTLLLGAERRGEERRPRRPGLLSRFPNFQHANTPSPSMMPASGSGGARRPAAAGDGDGVVAKVHSVTVCCQPEASPSGVECYRISPHISCQSSTLVPPWRDTKDQIGLRWHSGGEQWP